MERWWSLPGNDELWIGSSTRTPFTDVLPWHGLVAPDGGASRSPR